MANLTLTVYLVFNNLAFNRFYYKTIKREKNMYPDSKNKPLQFERKKNITGFLKSIPQKI